MPKQPTKFKYPVSDTQLSSLSNSPIEPSHYSSLDPQPIDVIEAWDLNFHRGCALKYIARAGRKSGNAEADDLRKAIWYLNREIAVLVENT